MYYSEAIDSCRRRILHILKELDGTGCTEKQMILWLQTSPKIVRRVLRILEDLHEIYRIKGEQRTVLWFYNLMGREDVRTKRSPLSKPKAFGASIICKSCRSLNNGPRQDERKCWRCQEPLEIPEPEG
jgi:hypothetical protein